MTLFEFSITVTVEAQDAASAEERMRPILAALDVIDYQGLAHWDDPVPVDKDGRDL